MRLRLVRWLRRLLSKPPVPARVGARQWEQEAMQDIHKKASFWPVYRAHHAYVGPPFTHVPHNPETRAMATPNTFAAHSSAAGLGPPLSSSLKKQLLDLGVFNIQARACAVTDPHSHLDSFVRFSLEATLAALAPVTKPLIDAATGKLIHYPYLPLERIGRHAQNRAPDGYTWVIHLLTTCSTVSYDHAAQEMKLLVDMYIASKGVVQPTVEPPVKADTVVPPSRSMGFNGIV